MERLSTAFPIALALFSCALPGGEGEEQGPVRVLTFNVLHGLLDEDPSAEPFDRLPERLPRMAAELERINPDAFLLQEVALGIGGYPDVLAELRRSAPGYELIWGDFFGSPPTHGPGQGLGQLIGVKAPIVAAGNHAAPNLSAFRFRSVLHVRLLARGRVLDLYNVHLQGPEQSALAERELRDVLGYLEATADPAGISVLAGDLNMEPDEAPLALIREAGFIEPVAASGFECSPGDRRGCTNSTLPLAEAGDRSEDKIDYLWLRGPAASRVSARPVLDQPFQLDSGELLWPSDHKGLMATIEVPP